MLRWASDTTLDNAFAIDRNGNPPVIEARQCLVLACVSLPKSPSDRNSVHSSEVLVTARIPGLAGTRPTGAHGESGVGYQGTPRRINLQCETVEREQKTGDQAARRS